MSLPNHKIKVLLGLEIEKIYKSFPFKIYDDLVIEFLSEISNEIISLSNLNENLRIFSYFALWSRKNNLLRFCNNIDIFNNMYTNINCKVNIYILFFFN